MPKQIKFAVTFLATLSVIDVLLALLSDNPAPLLVEAGLRVVLAFGLLARFNAARIWGYALAFIGAGGALFGLLGGLAIGAGAAFAGLSLISVLLACAFLACMGSEEAKRWCHRPLIRARWQSA